MQEIQLFNNPEFGAVNVVEIDNIPYFIGKEIAEKLGYVNPNKAVQMHVDSEDKKILNFKGFSQNGNAIQGLWKDNDFSNKILITESGFYSLILRSEHPKAKEFKHWVTSEVLPSIRKHGAYMTEPTLDRLLNDPDLVIGLATQLKEERAKVQAEKERNAQLTEKNEELHIKNLQQSQQIDQLKPVAAYAQMILNSPGLITTTQIAKDYGKSAVWLNRMLKGLGVQYLQNGQWLLYAKYAGYGYTHTKMVDYPRSDGIRDSKPFTMWTQKGRMFIYELLKKNGIVPMIEQSQISKKPY